MNKSSIGIFDSGVGGLTVAKEVFCQMPQENIIYFADTYNVPYGEKPLSQIKKIALSIVDFLVEQKVKAIIMGCNISSAVALYEAQGKYNIPIFGLIDTTVEDISLKSSFKKIGVIATSGTIKSGAYQRALSLKNLQVFASSCPEFVPLVERGEINSPHIRQVAQEYLSSLIENEIDGLILGCTHYPYLKKVIKEILPDKVKIIDPAKIVVKYAKSILVKKNLINTDTSSTKHRFLVSGSDKSLQEMGSKFLGRKIKKIEKVIWQKRKIISS